jgi:hypothetical protein
LERSQWPAGPIPAGAGAPEPAAVFEPLEFRADVLALPTGHVETGPLGALRAGHRAAGLGRGCGDRIQQRPVVIGTGQVTVRQEALAVILAVVDIGLAHSDAETLADLEEAIAHLRAALAD